MEFEFGLYGGVIMTTALFHYLHVSNAPVGPRLFTKLTEPGPGDPAIVRLGFDIRQSLAGVALYTYTAMKGLQAVTLAWLNVSGEEMTIQLSHNGRRQVTTADLPVIVAELVTGRPELKHPARALQALAELADEELFVHVVDNDTDEEIPFNGWPIPYDDGGADDYGLQPEA